MVAIVCCRGREVRLSFVFCGSWWLVVERELADEVFVHGAWATCINRLVRDIHQSQFPSILSVF